ncbi:copper homeostasis membrane protein CopD [Tatumella saanichensis]|uniref:copper homeostasis membrane protein CopD n=1 Tax=Tatumella saanichensis TaxID=480813 RepID=UPI0004B7F6ED|nr:copper homeostasis membrane protein CopD [Tatumella saanichensis]
MAESGFIILRFFHFSSLLFSSGALCYLWWLTPRDYRQTLQPLVQTPILWCAWLGLISAIGIFLCQTVLMSGEVEALWQPQVWQAVAGTRFGDVWVPGMLLAVLAAAIVRFKHPAAVYLFFVMTMVQLILVAGSGHAIAGVGWRAPLGWLLQSLHLLAAALWTGGLFPLLRLMRASGQQPLSRHAMHSMINFSRAAHLAVIVVVVSGGAEAYLVAGWPPTMSGWWGGLLFKTSLVALMIAIAVLNRYWLVPRFTQLAPYSQQWFRRLTRVEGGLALMAVAVVSLFSTLSPN